MLIELKIWLIGWALVALLVVIAGGYDEDRRKKNVNWFTGVPYDDGSWVVYLSIFGFLWPFALAVFLIFGVFAIPYNIGKLLRKWTNK